MMRLHYYTQDIDYRCIVIQVAMNCSIKSFFLSSPVCCKVRLLLFWLLLLYYHICMSLQG